MSAENRADDHNIENISANVIKTERKIDSARLQQDYDICKKLQWERDIYGFIESCDITSRSVFVVLSGEGSVKLYHGICEIDILYFDATGSIINAI